MAGISTFKAEYTETARAMAEKGATDREIAEEIGVSERTLNRWKHTQEGFAEQIRLGKQAPDDRVEQSLYRRATGYTFEAQKVFQYQGEPVVVDYVEHVPPDTTAAIFWLKNRRKDEWRDKQVLEHEGNLDLAAAIAAGNARLARSQGHNSASDEVPVDQAERLRGEGAALRKRIEGQVAADEHR